MNLSASRDISRPAADVFEFFADASNNPRWQDGMVSCGWATPPPIAVGSTYEQHAKFMGRDVRSVFRVTEFDQGTLVAIETIESTFPIQVRRSVSSTGPATCQVNAEITGGPGGVMKLLEPLMARFAQRSVDADYDRLKTLLESE